VPTLIFIDPKDELISYRKLKKAELKDEWGLCQVVELDSDLSYRSGNYHHLILDEATMGEKNWTMVVKTMKRFLFGI
jgi:hypothetical protein